MNARLTTTASFKSFTLQKSTNLSKVYAYQTTLNQARGIVKNATLIQIDSVETG